MRIAYLAHANSSHTPGIRNKITTHAQQWRVRGHDARLYVMTRDDPEVWTSRYPDTMVGRYTHFGSRLRQSLELVRAIRDFDPDVIYFRYDLFYPTMAALPSRARRVIEVNTDDTVEFALGSRRRYRYNEWTRRLVYGRADAIVFVTRELSERPSFQRFRARKVVITNGIELAAYPEAPAPDGPHPTLVFVGNASRPTWHGVDKVARLAKLRPEWHFEVVGDAMAREEAPANLAWHGLVERPELLTILARADIEIGALALHRNGLTEASTLKVREYLAVGLPVLCAYVDPDLDPVKEFALMLPNDEPNVEDGIAEIDAFVARVVGQRVPRQRVGHIDVGEKERRRLEVFESLIGG